MTKENFDIVERVRHNDPKLIRIDFLDQAAPPTEMIPLIAEALTNNTNVEYLDWRNCAIDRKGIEALSRALKLNKTVTDLDLGSNYIGEDIEILSEAIKVNTSLVRVDLSNNHISDEEIRSLAEALKHNKSISYLILNDNQISDEGIGYLAEALKFNQTISWLELINTELTKDGANVLIDALKSNKTLIKIKLVSDGLFPTSLLSSKNEEIDDKIEQNINQALAGNRLLFIESCQKLKRMKDNNFGQDTINLLNKNDFNRLKAQLNLTDYSSDLESSDIESLFPDINIDEIYKIFLDWEKVILPAHDEAVAANEGPIAANVESSNVVSNLVLSTEPDDNTQQVIGSASQQSETQYISSLSLSNGPSSTSFVDSLAEERRNDQQGSDHKRQRLS